jgi:drug/metabolite transporter (DMT)-like permease
MDQGQMEATKQRQRETTGLLLGLVGVLVFAATLPMTRLALPWLSPGFLTFGRAALAGVIATGVLLALKRPLPRPEHRLPLLIAAIGLVFGFPGFSALGLQTVPAGHGGVIVGILPLATAVAGCWLTGDRPSFLFWLAGVIGAVLVVAFALFKAGGAVTIGHLWLLAAILVCAVGYAFSARLSGFMPGWEVISWALVLSLPLTLPLTFLNMPADPSAVPMKAWAAFVYLGLMSMYLGFFAWNAGLAMGGVARVSQVQLLQGFVTIGIAALLLGETLEISTLGFAGAVAVTVLMGRRAPIRRKAQSA